MFFITLCAFSSFDFKCKMGAENAPGIDAARWQRRVALQIAALSSHFLSDNRTVSQIENLITAAVGQPADRIMS